MNNDFGGLIIRRDALEQDEDFAQYVVANNANLGSNDGIPQLLAIKFNCLPFAIRMDPQLAEQLRDGLNICLASTVSDDDDTQEMDFNIGGDKEGQ